MTSAPEDLHAGYKAAWKALPRRDRMELTQAALKGHRSVNRWDAAVTLWWSQRELRYGLRNSLLVAAGVAVGLSVLSWVLTGVPPTSIFAIFQSNPMLPVFLLIPFASAGLRRPRLRVSAQVNAAVLAGKTFDAPPDPEEAERLLARARKQGWFRGPRPEPDPGN